MAARSVQCDPVPEAVRNRAPLQPVNSASIQIEIQWHRTVSDDMRPTTTASRRNSAQKASRECDVLIMCSFVSLHDPRGASLSIGEDDSIYSLKFVQNHRSALSTPSLTAERCGERPFSSRIRVRFDKYHSYELMNMSMLPQRGLQPSSSRASATSK